MPKTWRQTIGLWGEDQAVNFLKRQGYIILERNFNGRYGEIDIIASVPFKKNNLFFIEVKTRNYGSGSAEQATSKLKLHKISQAAKQYCLEKKVDLDDCLVQFEHISVYVDKKNSKVNFVKYEIPICIVY